MTDLILETTGAAVVAGLFVFLWHHRGRLSRRGGPLILGGFGLLLFGSVLDITDNFESLNRFVVVGDTAVQAILEKFFGFLGGFLLLAIGLIRWIPTVVSEQKRNETERRLQYQANFERIVTTISSEFVRYSPDEIDRGIQNTLERIGRFAGVDRSYVFLFREDGKTIDNTHEWCAEGIEPQIEHLGDITIDRELPWFARAIRNLEDIYIPSVSDMPEEAAVERSHFQMQEIQSLVVVPMISGGKLRGFLGFDSVRCERTWADEVTHLLTIVGEIFASALERTSIEVALRESESRYRLLAENSGDVIWTSDLEFHWRYISPSFEQLTGFTPDEAMKFSIEEMLTPSSAKTVTEMLAAVLQAAGKDSEVLQKLTTVEVEFNCKDGTTVWAEVKTSFVFAEDGQPVGIVGVSRDVTENRRARAELSEAKEAAESANRAKSEFLANMSHEIRSPMTAILGFADILLEQPNGKESLRSAETIRRNANHLLEVINDILDLSRIEAGQMLIEQKAFSPVKLLDEVTALMEVRAEAKGLHLEVARQSPIPESIQSDSTRLRQILINLIGNAVKFTEVGSVRIAVELKDAQTDDPKLQFQVIDTGIGMTAAQIERVFEPFAQADTSTTRQYGGSGLGLTISKRLVEELGGDITIDSQSGRGSTFTLTVATGPLDSVRMIDNKTEPERCNDDLPAKLSARKPNLRCRVLLAEDGPDNQRLISFILEAAGADVTVADNGQEAIKRLHEADEAGNPFDLVLMDMQMPVLDGYHATKYLRTEGFDRPIIALTAHAMTSDRQKCIDAGCDDYMTKPIDRDELIERVASHAPQRRVGGVAEKK